MQVVFRNGGSVHNNHVGSRFSSCPPHLPSVFMDLNCLLVFRLCNNQIRTTYRGNQKAKTVYKESHYRLLVLQLLPQTQVITVDRKQGSVKPQ